MSVTYNPKRKKRFRTHGFFSRLKTVGGRSVLLRRMRKGRHSLSVSTKKK